MIIVSTILFALRFFMGNPTIPGVYPYYYLLSSSQSGYGIFHLFVSFLHLSFRGYWVVSILGTLLLFALFYNLLHIHHRHPVFVFASVFLFVLTPTTLYLSAFFGPYLFALILLCFVLLLIRSNHPLIAGVPFIGLLFFDQLVFFCTITLIATYLAFLERRNTIFWFLFASFFSYITRSIFFWPPVFQPISEQHLFISLFSDLGGLYGVGFFVIILGIIGIAQSWQSKKIFLPAYLSLLVFFVIYQSLSPLALLFFYPLIIFFAASGFLYFWERDWSLPLVRFLTLALILYGVLFSGISYIGHTASLPPTPLVFDSLDWFRIHAPSSSVVLSHPSRGFWLSYGSGLVPFVDYTHSDFALRSGIASELFASRDIKKTIPLLEHYNISFIWIDPAMKNGEVWRGNDEGILFLFRNERFKRVYNQNGIEIWMFDLNRRNIKDPS